MQYKRFLVTGASGFIGRTLSVELDRRGYEVRCAVRGETDDTGLPGELVSVGEVDSSTRWDSALADVDVVVHLAAHVHVMQETASDPLDAFRTVNVQGTETIARAAAEGGVRRLVYVSSIGVNGNCSGREPFTERSTPAPYSPYTISKFEAEQVLLSVSAETGLEVVIIRPPLVYGPNNPGNFLRLLQLVGRGLPLPLASVQNARSMIYIGNLVDALIVSALHPGSAGQTYLVSDGDDMSTPQLIRGIAHLMGKSAKLWAFPPALLKLVARSVGKSSEVDSVIGSLVIDSSKICEELNWSAPFTSHEGLAETVKWFQGESQASTLKL